MKNYYEDWFVLNARRILPFIQDEDKLLSANGNVSGVYIVSAIVDDHTIPRFMSVNPLMSEQGCCSI